MTEQTEQVQVEAQQLVSYLALMPLGSESLERAYLPIGPPSITTEVSLVEVDFPRHKPSARIPLGSRQAPQSVREGGEVVESHAEQGY